MLLLTGAAIAWPGVGATQQPNAGAADSPAVLPWGEVVDGLQLLLETGRNTDTLIATQSMLYLMIRAQNVSSTPIYVDFDEATYDFEYEIDGVWYGFERRSVVRTTRSVSGGGRNDSALAMIAAIAPGSSRYAMLTVSLGADLYAVTSGGTGTRFEPTPGAHVVRVRPGPLALQGREPPVSNAVTVNVRTAVASGGERSASFASAAAMGLDGLRFASGPADALELIRNVVARPPNPSQVPQLLAAGTFEVLEPLPFYELVLPRIVNAPDPPLPTRSGPYHYLVRAGGRFVNTIALSDYPTGAALHWIGSERTSQSRFEALRALAQMPAIAGRNYEPRLLRITGVRGTLSFQVVWLHSSLGLPDLFYRIPDPDFGGKTSVELDRLYNAEELMTAARTLPLTPKHDERWAAATAATCAQGERGTFGGPLIYEAARVEIGLNDTGDGVVWYVYFPEPMRETVGSHMGAAFFVDEADAMCRRANLGG